MVGPKAECEPVLALLRESDTPMLHVESVAGASSALESASVQLLITVGDELGKAENRLKLNKLAGEGACLVVHYE